MSRWSLITCDGVSSLSKICQIHQVNLLDIVNANTGEESPDTSYRSMREYLVSKVFKPIERGVVLKIPCQSSGGVSSEQDDKYYAFLAQYDQIVNTRTPDRRVPPNSPDYLSLVTKAASTSTLKHPGISRSAYTPISSNWKSLGCSVTILAGGSPQGVYILPVFPQEFSDNNSVVFNSETLFGRSVDYQTYVNSGRDVSFILTLHEELCPNNYGYVREVVAKIQSACYPAYSSGGLVDPPEVKFVIGNQFKIRGVLKGVSASWKGPIIDKRLVNCDLGISIQETTGPYSMADVAKMKGYRE